MNALRTIIPNEQIEVEEQSLLTLINELVAIAAERFCKDSPRMLPPLTKKEPFMKIVERYAKEHFEPKDAETNTLFSKTLSLFWSPMSRIYGSPAKAIINDESNEDTTSTPP